MAARSGSAPCWKTPRVSNRPKARRDRLKPGGSCRAVKETTGAPFCEGVIAFDGTIHHRASNLQHQMRAGGVQRICCWAFIRRCTSHCTVLSVTAVEIGSSRRLAVA